MGPEKPGPINKLLKANTFKGDIMKEKSIFGLYVARDGIVNYPGMIIDGSKTIETRPGSRNVLKRLLGERVAVIDTSVKPHMVIGYITIYGSMFCPSNLFGEFRKETLIPAGSAYDDKGAGKYLYYLTCPIKCQPYALPENIVNHGRSYCEFRLPA